MTHAAVGAALAVALVPVDPELATVAAYAGALGGTVPDFDLLVEHRKSFHFPAYGWLLAVPAAAVALLAPSPLTVAVAFVLLSATLHAVMDVFGGPSASPPWEATDDRAVYLHLQGRWIAPRRGVPYDGSPADLLVATVASVPVLVAFDGVLRALALLGLVLSVVYTVFRRRISAALGV